MVQAHIAADRKIRIKRQKTELRIPLQQVWKNAEKQKQIKVAADGLALPRGIEPLFQP